MAGRSRVGRARRVLSGARVPRVADGPAPETLGPVRSACLAASGFGALLDALPGVPPDEALAALDALSGERGYAACASGLAADARRDGAPPRLDQCAALPLPHPLDSEFRFTAQSAGRLAAELVEATRPGDEILLVGTPSVAVALAGVADRRVRFVGPEGCVREALASVGGANRAWGLAGPATAAAALLDPPWYDGPVRSMLAACAWACRPGAPVLLAGPLPGARPSAGSDALRYREIARGLGLEHDGDAGEVRYATPLFELAAMERQGLARLASWRRGALVRYRATGRGGPSLAPPPPPGAVELTLGGVRLRLSSPRAAGPPALVPICDGAVFPSVSARAPGRGAANLWSSGNRAFSVDGRAALAAMRAVARREGLPDGRTPVRRACVPLRLKPFDPDPALVDQFYELVEGELQGARRLVGDGSWLSSARGWRS